MRRLQWKGAYDSGHLGIDRQHREIVERVNAVIGAVEERSARDAVIAAFDALTDVLEAHWRDEERMFERRKSPFAGEQRMAHRAMRHEIAWIRSRASESGDDAIAKAGRALRVWTETRFARHIAEDVRALGPLSGGDRKR